MTEPKQERPQPTERFQRVLAFASDEADGLGHGYITCQHLLYALSRESKGLASAALEAFGITPDRLHDLLADANAAHDRIENQIDLADEVGGVLTRAVDAAHQWGHRWLDTEHILYGILTAATSADEMFAVLHVSPGEIVNKLTALQNGAPATTVREEAAHAYRFTLESAWLLSLATDAARQHGSAVVTSLHLLLALLLLESSARRVLLEEFDLQIEDVRRRVGRSEGSVQTTSRLPLADDVQRILGYAIGEAWNRGHLAVTPLHLAMGLARAERHAALDILADLGVPQADLTEAISAVMPPSTIR